MKPGRELDALIAEKVMGLGPVRWLTGMPVYDSGIGKHDLRSETAVPFYSTDIAAAWQVVEKMGIEALVRLTEGRWEVEIGGVNAIGESAPHAICLVALSSVGAITWCRARNDWVLSAKARGIP